MGLHRISRVYLADDSGLRSLGSSSRMGSEAMKAAAEIAAAANSVGKGSYSALPAVVTAGWVNERRMGAVVREVRPDWRDTRDAVLLKVLNGMGNRGAEAAGLVRYTRKDGTTRTATAAQAAHWGRGRK